MPQDNTRSRRLLELLLLLLAQPYRYTRHELEVRYNVSEDTVRRDIAVLRDAGLRVEQDAAYRFAVLPEGQSTALKHLQALTAAERETLMRAAEGAFAKTGHAAVVRRKLSSLMDFQRLGLRALRSPELAKIDALERAVAAGCCVRLIGYRSTNSRETADRLVEAFYLDTANGIAHAYDLARGALRHFRLDRMDRVEVLDGEPWRHAGAHVVEATDAFRIVSRRQVRVHLRLGVAAYNDLVERFPGARAYTAPGAETDTYDFDARVNAGFLGVSGFVLGNAGDVEVLEPEGLVEEVRGRAGQFFTDASPPPAIPAGGSG